MRIALKEIMPARICILALCAAQVVISAAYGQVFLPSGFTATDLIVSGVTAPTTMCIAPDGTIYIAEQAGGLRVWREGTGLLQDQFFSNSPLNVNSLGERGLIGVILDPEFVTNRYIYVHYTVEASLPYGRISRFTADTSGEHALPDSEIVLLDLDPPPFGAIHNGGALRFGSDGMLYVGVGHSTEDWRSQSINTLLGKILRINREPGDVIPPDNPTSFPGVNGSPVGNNRAIWAVGLRNPFVIDVQPGTGAMMINDVGAGLYEEINEGLPGRNYGWSSTEGPFNEALYPNFTPPVFSYEHIGGSCITAGVFYNPESNPYPHHFFGNYFFADYTGKWIKRLDLATNESASFAYGIEGIVAMQVDRFGRLLILNRTGQRILTHVEYSPSEQACIAQQIAKLAIDTQSNDTGGDVALDGDTVIVSAPSAPGAGTAVVHVYDGVGWVKQATLTSSDGLPYDRFGISVAISEDTVLVGARDDNHEAGSSAGSAYVFLRSGQTWSQQAKLIASDAAFVDHFGNAVALSGETAVVCSSLDDNAGGIDAGSAYVFVRSNEAWTQQAKLTASDGATNSKFGTSVAISGETILIDARSSSHSGLTSAGAVYVFVRSGENWTEQAKLTASDAAQSDLFGSVSLDGDSALIGAFRDDHSGITDAGSVYVFVRTGNTWSEVAKLTAFDAALGDAFGVSVAIHGDSALIGATGDDNVGGMNAGSAYLYSRFQGEWSFRAKLLPSDSISSLFLGRSAELDEFIVLGSLNKFTPAYVFDPIEILTPGELNGDSTIDENDVAVFAQVLAGFDTVPVHMARADMDCSGYVDGLDIQAFVNILLSE